MTDEEIRARSKRAIDEEHVMLFMKGTPDMPRCGFSARIDADAQRERRRVRGDGHPARPAHPPGALRAVGLADDPAAVRQRRAGRRLRHRHRDVRVRRAGGDARRRAAARAEAPAAQQTAQAPPCRSSRSVEQESSPELQDHERHYTVEQANAALPWVGERLERIREALANAGGARTGRRLRTGWRARTAVATPGWPCGWCGAGR